MTAGHAHRDRGAEWDLIEAAQSGDRDAFGQLYTRYAGGVCRFVASRTGDPGLAQDLTSETFLRAWRRIDSVSYQGRDAGAWFTTIARNLVADHLKSSRHKLEHTTAELPEHTAGPDRGPEQVALQKDTAAELRRHVAALPPAQRECLARRFGQECSVPETASVMGRNVEAVKALQHRAIKGLRASLTTDAAEPVAPLGHRAQPRARRAVAQVAQHVASDTQSVAEQQRAQQVTRWHTDDHAAASGSDSAVASAPGDGRGVA